MAPRTGERRPIPVLDMERERAAAAPSPVVTYKLPPEEIERIFSKSKPAQQGSMAEFIASPGDAKRKRFEINQTEELIEVTLTKEQYLQERLAGKTRNKICTEQGINPASLYHWLKKWGIKEVDAEERALDEYQLGAKKAEPAGAEQPATEEPRSKEDPNSTYQALKAFADKDSKAEIERLREELEKTRVHRDDLKAEVERLKAVNAEVVAMTGMAAEKYEEKIRLLREEITKALNENERLDTDNQELQREMDEKEQEIVDLMKQLKGLMPLPAAEGIEWFTPEAIQPDPTISVSKEGISFDPETTKRMGLAAGDCVQIGFAADRMVMRKSDSGFRLQRGTENTVRFASKMLAKWSKFQAVPKGKHLLKQDANGLFFVEVAENDEVHRTGSTVHAG